MKKFLLVLLAVALTITGSGCDEKKPLSDSRVAKLHRQGVEVVFTEENWEDNYSFAIMGDNIVCVMNEETYVPNGASMNISAMNEIKIAFKTLCSEILSAIDAKEFYGIHAVGTCDKIIYHFTEEQVSEFFGSEFLEVWEPYIAILFYTSGNRKGMIRVSMYYPIEGQLIPADMYFFVNAQNCPYRMSYFVRIENPD